MGQLYYHKCKRYALKYLHNDGVGWRKDATKWLKTKGVKVLDPCDKPISYTAYKEIDVEKHKMMELKSNGRYFELSQRMREIAHVDHQ